MPRRRDSSYYSGHPFNCLFVTLAGVKSLVVCVQNFLELLSITVNRKGILTMLPN